MIIDRLYRLRNCSVTSEPKKHAIFRSSFFRQPFRPRGSGSLQNRSKSSPAIVGSSDANDLPRTLNLTVLIVLVLSQLLSAVLRLRCHFNRHIYSESVGTIDTPQGHLHRFLARVFNCFRLMRSEIPPCRMINLRVPASTYEYSGSQLNRSLNRSRRGALPD